MNATTCIECNVLHCDALQVLENGEGSVKDRRSALHIVNGSTLPIIAGRCQSARAVVKLVRESVKSCSS